MLAARAAAECAILCLGLPAEGYVGPRFLCVLHRPYSSLPKQQLEEPQNSVVMTARPACCVLGGTAAAGGVVCGVRNGRGRRRCLGPATEARWGRGSRGVPSKGARSPRPRQGGGAEEVNASRAASSGAVQAAPPHSGGWLAHLMRAQYRPVKKHELPPFLCLVLF